MNYRKQIFNHHFFSLKMPAILKHEQKKFQQTTNTTDYYKSPYIKPIELEEGGGLFSGIGSLAKTGINFLKSNKDVISNVAKGIGGVGSAAASIASAVESRNKLEQLNKIQEMRNKMIEKQSKSLSDKTKKQLQEKLGKGFITVD